MTTKDRIIMKFVPVSFIWIMYVLTKYCKEIWSRYWENAFWKRLANFWDTLYMYVCMYVCVYFYSLPPRLVHCYSEAVPTTTRKQVCQSFTPKRSERELWVKNLLKVPTWRLGWGSNPRRSGRRQAHLPTVPPRLTGLWLTGFCRGSGFNH